MKTYRKISDTLVEVITPQPDKVERISLDDLIRVKQNLIDQLGFINTSIQEAEDKIIEFKSLGIKTATEVIPSQPQ